MKQPLVKMVNFQTSPGSNAVIQFVLGPDGHGIHARLDVCAIGEVGLGGEVRSVPQIEQRVAQARRRGYKKLLVPITQVDASGSGGIPVASVGDLELFFDNYTIVPISEQRLSDEEKVGIAQCA